MKMISHYKNENELDVQLNISEAAEIDSSYSNIGLNLQLNNDRGEVLTREHLMSCIHAQFEVLYQTNHKRKFLLKEVSSYFVRK